MQTEEEEKLTFCVGWLDRISRVATGGNSPSPMHVSGWSAMGSSHLKPNFWLQIRIIAELLAGRQNPTAGVQGGEPPRRIFTTELRVPGTGATHKELFIQKTRQWMEANQVLAEMRSTEMN